MDWKRLATAVRERRRELMLSQAEVASSAGISELTMRSLEGARRENYRVSTLRGLTRALGWSADSVDRVLEGGDPIVLDTPDEPVDLHTEVTRLRRELAELRATVEALTERG